MSDQVIFVGMIFIIALLMSQAFVSPLMGSSAQARRRLRGRIRELGQEGAAQQHAVAVRSKSLRRLSPVGQRLESLPGMEQLTNTIEQAGFEYFAHRFVAAALAIGVVVGLGVGLYQSSPLYGLVGGAIGLAAPFFWLQSRRTSRMAKFEEQLPDALSITARSLQAGLPFSEAMHVVAVEMTEPVSKEFGTVFTELNYGGDVRSALLGMLERMPTIAVMAMVSSILIQRETGGNLAEVLDRIGNLVRQRFRFQRSVKTLTAEGRMTAYVATGMPFALAGLYQVVNPGYLDALTKDPGGRYLIYVAFVMMVVGVLWLRKMVRLDL
jgi:tight adherence protein B